jgi:hypothetical protein
MQSRAHGKRWQILSPYCRLLPTGGTLSAVLAGLLLGCGGGASGPDTSSSDPQSDSPAPSSPVPGDPTPSAPTPSAPTPSILPPAGETPELDTVTSVYLRLRNTSSMSFDTILVRVDKTIDFGALPAGKDSEYLPADGSYSYAYIEGSTGETRFVARPDDYVGEQMLGPGYYTYSLSAGLNPETSNSGWLGILLSKDPRPY